MTKHARSQLSRQPRQKSSAKPLESQSQVPTFIPNSLGLKAKTPAQAALLALFFSGTLASLSPTEPSRAERRAERKALEQCPRNNITLTNNAELRPLQPQRVFTQQPLPLYVPEKHIPSSQDSYANPILKAIEKSDKKLPVVTEADPFALDENGDSIFHILVKEQDLEKLKLVFHPDCGALKNSEGETPFSLAYKRGYGDIVKYFLQKNVPVDIPIEGETPLIWAIQNKKYRFVHWLLKANADAKSNIDKKHNAITYAVLLGDEKAIEILLKYGHYSQEELATYNLINYALIKNHIKIAEYLAKNGVTVPRSWMDFINVQSHNAINKNLSAVLIGIYTFALYVLLSKDKDNLLTPSEKLLITPWIFRPIALLTGLTTFISVTLVLFFIVNTENWIYVNFQEVNDSLVEYYMETMNKLSLSLIIFLGLNLLEVVFLHNMLKPETPTPTTKEGQSAPKARNAGSRHKLQFQRVSKQREALKIEKPKASATKQKITTTEIPVKTIEEKKREEFENKKIEMGYDDCLISYNDMIKTDWSKNIVGSTEERTIRRDVCKFNGELTSYKEAVDLFEKRTPGDFHEQYFEAMEALRNFKGKLKKLETAVKSLERVRGRAPSIAYNKNQFHSNSPSSSSSAEEAQIKKSESKAEKRSVVENENLLHSSGSSDSEQRTSDDESEINVNGVVDRFTKLFGSSFRMF